jgi:hypothetical protein
MILMILRLLSLIPTTLRLSSELALENLALRQQLAVLNRRHGRPKLRKLDRFFWVLLSRTWEHWKETLSSLSLKLFFAGIEGVSPPTGLSDPSTTARDGLEKTARSGS